MITSVLITILIVTAIAASVSLLHAVKYAEEGYEDESGFHRVADHSADERPSVGSPEVARWQPGRAKGRGKSAHGRGGMLGSNLGL